ncbi:hypothetical protein [Clostridium sp. JN-1]|uniref:hypothetical protein n=1 Tax=Clostridium sp. JN-1 TaxID=2483110 RepID=UPI000F0B60A5|nr:hypothetical protein [Clostridium sp. JN-1]
MNIESWKLWLFSSICFLFVAIMNLIDKKYLIGITFGLLGVFYIFLSMNHYKKDKKSNNNGEIRKNYLYNILIIVICMDN